MQAVKLAPLGKVLSSAQGMKSCKIQDGGVKMYVDKLRIESLIGEKVLLTLLSFKPVLSLCNLHNL